MLGRLLVPLLLISFPLAGCLGPAAPLEPGEDSAPSLAGSQDAVVIAVVDFGLNPYHLEWAAGLMPQHQDDDPANDFPLGESPEAWLPGFVPPSGGVHPLNLTRSDDPEADVLDLMEKDKETLAGIRTSSPDDVHLYYVPGTKIIGVVDFMGGVVTTSNAHGAKSASVSTGSLYGTCPECLLVFVNLGNGEDGFEWALRQPWIDVVTNSYGFSSSGLVRDRVYAGSDLALSRGASERGQTILFSAGNGVNNDFITPNPTLLSSQEGPDWMITVGAVHPQNRGSYTGHGKPADIASIGSAYPSQGGTRVGESGTFGGTSSATPTTAGTYARALWWARTTLEGDSRVQEEGVIARGAYSCPEAFPECPLGDGVLTAVELRQALFQGALHTGAGMSLQGQALPAVGEEEFLNEGHGTYFGRMDGDEAWAAEFGRITGPLGGTAAPPARPAGEREWFIVDSWCRQHIWGEWKDGDYVAGQTQLPGPSPSWPLRTSLQAGCQGLTKPPGA